jgi:hypothetical protein
MQSNSQPRAVNAVTRALFEEVFAAWDQDAIGKWIRSAHENNRITAIQCLTVILSEILSLSRSDDEESDREIDETDWQIVADWSKELFEASQLRTTREVTPYDSVSGIPLQATPPNWEWSLAVSDADAFLERRGYRRFCSSAIASWYGIFYVRGIRLESDLAQETIVESSEGASPASDGINLRKKVLGSAWSDDQYALLKKDFEEAKGKSIGERQRAVASLWGMGEDNVKKQLAIIKDRTKAKSPFSGLGAVKSGPW